MLLHIDSNEPNKMRTLAQRLGYPVRKTTLRIPGERYCFGDYLMGSNRFAVIAERKTGLDIMSSIRDGRVFYQISYMAEVAELFKMIPIVFIEGSLREARTKEKQRIRRMYLQKRIERMYEPPSITRLESDLTSLHTRVLHLAPTVIIRHVTNGVQLLRAMHGYATRIAEGKIGAPRPRGITVANRGLAFQTFMIATAFNVSESKARNILEHYGSFKDFIETADERSLTYAKGIGPISAKIMMKRLRLLKS